MEDNKKVYKIKVFCSNCDFEGDADIPMSIEVKKHPCPKCGCQTLFLKNEF